jgi:hypothetical protein
MPRLPYTRQHIELPVSDRVYQDTTFKQKARFTKLVHDQSETESKVVVTVLVTMYANDNGTYGMLMTGKGFQPYPVDMTADNSCLVDAETGEILAERTTESNAHWAAIADLHPKNVMWQGDFFEMLRDSQDIRIGNLITQHIQNADRLGRFA